MIEDVDEVDLGDVYVVIIYCFRIFIGVIFRSRLGCIGYGVYLFFVIWLVLWFNKLFSFRELGLYK